VHCHDFAARLADVFDLHRRLPNLRAEPSRRFIADAEVPRGLLRLRWQAGAQYLRVSRRSAGIDTSFLASSHAALVDFDNTAWPLLIFEFGPTLYVF
jgi:hypothetical protein